MRGEEVHMSTVFINTILIEITRRLRKVRLKEKTTPQKLTPSNSTIGNCTHVTNVGCLLIRHCMQRK